MPLPFHRPQPLPPRRRRVLGWVAALVAAPWLARTARANSDGGVIEVQTLNLRREDGSVMLDFDLRVQLPAVAEDALRRGLPIYFVAQVTLLRSRWYWRDERISRVERQWRLSYQPLTGSYRVSLGAIGQTHTRLEEALSAVSRLARWEVADAARVASGERHYAEFNWRLDTSQLPRPIQFGLGGGAGTEWTLSVERTLKLES